MQNIYANVSVFRTGTRGATRHGPIVIDFRLILVEVDP
jgi:ABC-type sulfate transport system substrate-binding protein